MKVLKRLKKKIEGGLFSNRASKKMTGGVLSTVKKHRFSPPRRVLHRVYPSSHVFYPSGFFATLCFYPVVFTQQSIERHTIDERQNQYQPTVNPQTTLKSPI